MNSAAATSTALPQPATAAERQGLVNWAASKYGVDAGKVFPILKQTCFKGEKNNDGTFRETTDAEVAALMIVAREYGLNPFLKEIYAFPDKKGGIVPVVGVDGWISIVNDHAEFDGVEFIYGEEKSGVPEWVECHMHRKDRKHPIKIRELMAECKRGTGPWNSHPSRMLRHKAFIQCARVAFGFAGIFDDDEAERIVGAGTAVTGGVATAPTRGATALKNALAGGDGLDVTEVRPTPAAAASAPDQAATAQTGNASSSSEPTVRHGTTDLLDRFLTAFKGSTDPEILALKRDEARMFEWTPADLAEINKAFETRRSEIEAL